MPRYSTAFGMDVHLRSTTVCALDAETGEAVTRRFRGNPWGEVAEWMSGFPGPSLAAYESGYLGFAPQRELSGLGVDCVVAAVSRVPRSAADLSSKNDRNDAARMAKAILSHDISPVWVPSPEIEGLRDLAGAHDAATARLAAAKQRLLAFLARRGYAYGGTTPAGFDCSGFVQSVYANFGVSLPRTSYEQQNAGYEVSYADAQPGDLICYGGHVAIYMGNGQIVHASNSRDGIKISNNAAYRTILSVRRPS